VRPATQTVFRRAPVGLPVGARGLRGRDVELARPEARSSLARVAAVRATKTRKHEELFSFVTSSLRGCISEMTSPPTRRCADRRLVDRPTVTGRLTEWPDYRSEIDRSELTVCASRPANERGQNLT